MYENSCLLQINWYKFVTKDKHVLLMHNLLVNEERTTNNFYKLTLPCQTCGTRPLKYYCVCLRTVNALSHIQIN